MAEHVEMAQATLMPSAPLQMRPPGLRGFLADWASDQRAFNNVSWMKAMLGASALSIDAEFA